MAEHLLSLIRQWKNSSDEQSCGFQDLFRTVLSNHPYYLRYSLDRTRPSLFMIHPTEGSDLRNPVVLESNGVVLDNSSFDVVAYGMPTMDTLSDGLPDTVPENWRAEAAEDGTVLRVFWHDEWIVSTNRRIDASRVRWSSEKSFYDLMAEGAAAELGMAETCDLKSLFNEHLDKDSVHSFVVLHPENQLVIGHLQPGLVYVSRRRKTDLDEVEVMSVPFAKLPEKLQGDEVQKLLAGENIRDMLRTKRGVIYSDWSDPKLVRRYKVDFPGFTMAHDLRRNLPTMDLSYLAAQDDEERKWFRVFFPPYQHMFDFLDEAVSNLATDVFQIYRRSYIKKEFMVDPSDDVFSALRAVHYKYRHTGEPIQVSTLIEVLQTLPVHYVSHMLSKGRIDASSVIRKEKPADVQ